MLSQKWYKAGLEVSQLSSHVRETFSGNLSQASPRFIPYSLQFSQRTTNLFSLNFPTDSEYFFSNHTHLFNLLKQFLMSTQDPDLSQPDHLAHCQVFLQYLLYSLASIDSLSKQRHDLQVFGESISAQLLAVTLLVGSLSDVSNTSKLETVSEREPFLASLDMEPFTYLLIEIKSHFLLSHYLIARLLPEFNVQVMDCIHSTWAHLLEKAAVIFSAHSDLLRLSFSPFHCSDVSELWCLTALLSDGLSRGNSGGSAFWDLFIPILLAFPDFHFKKSDIRLQVEKNKFFWWIVVNLSRILPLSLKHQNKNCWDLSRGAVLALAQLESESNSPQLAFSLWNLIQLSSYWGPSMDSVMLLWEKFSKRLGEASSLPDQRQISVRDVAELRYGIVNNPSELRSPLQATVFELFLRFFSLQFKLVDEYPNDCWKQYKGRFYSKLSVRRLQTPTADSILHLYLLTFLLGYQTDVNDVIDKSSEIFLKLLASASTLPSGLQLLIWESIFGLFHVYTDKSISLSPFFSRIVPTLLEYQNTAIFDASYARSHWTICNLLWLELPDLCCCSEQLAPVSELIKELYVSYYSAFHSEHITAITVNLTQVLSGFSNLLTENDSLRSTCRELCLFFWELGYPNWKHDHLIEITVPELGPLLSRLILLSLASECTLTVCLTDVIRDLLLNSGISCQAGSCFIRVLLCEEVGKRYITQNRVISKLIIKAWLLYIIQTHRYPQFTSSLISCTNELRVLPILERATAPVSSLSEVIAALELVLQALPSSPQEAIESQYYFSDLLEWLEPHLCDPNTPKECMFAIYRISSSLVRYCPTIIYSRTQTHCLLPRLIEYLFLPTHSLSKLPHPSHLDCVRRYLVEFLLSLFVIQTETDHFIQRKIRQLFSKYFNRFLQPPLCNRLVPSKPNPLISLFDSSSLAQPDRAPLAIGAALYYLSLVRELFLKLPQPPNILLSTLLFLEKATDVAADQLLACCGEYLFFPMLGCLLACNVCPREKEPQQVRAISENILKKILRAVDTKRDSCHRQKLIESINEFVLANMPSCHGKVFTTLRLFAQLDPNLLISCIASFRSCLLEFERGDAKLATEIRVELERLVSLLNTTT